MGHTYDNNTSSKQSKYKYTMKFTRLIASTLMLLVVLMASTASARSIAFPEPQNFVAMPSVHNVRHVRLVDRWRKSAEPGSSIHLIHCPSIPDHLTDVLRTSKSLAAELTLWSAKLVSQMSPRKSSAEGSLTHMSALRRSNAAELTL